MLKDRTAELIRIRQEVENLHQQKKGSKGRRDADRHDEEGAGQPTDGDSDSDSVAACHSGRRSASTDGHGKKTEFFEKVNEAWKLLTELGESVEQVKRLQSAVINSPSPENRMLQELDAVMITIRMISITIRTKLKEVKDAVSEGEGDAPKTSEQIDKDKLISKSSTHVRLGKTQHSALVRIFVELMTDYRFAQINYRDKCKARVYRQLEINGSTLTDEEVDQIIEDGNLVVFTKGIIHETQEARQVLADIEARHQDLIKLEKSIQELHDLFIEMAFLVECQSEMIDRIEVRTARAQENVMKADETFSEIQGNFPSKTKLKSRHKKKSTFKTWTASRFSCSLS